MKWYENNLSRALEIKFPIIQAPMASASSIELAAAVSNAGGLGSLGLGYHKTENILDDYNKLLLKTNHSFNLNFMAHKEPTNSDSKKIFFRDLMQKYYNEYNIAEVPDLIKPCNSFNEEQLDLLLSMSPRVASFHFGIPNKKMIAKIKEKNIFIISSATNVKEAKILESEGVDAIIAQGFEAGGHRGTFATSYKEGEVGLFSLIPQVVDSVSIPVIAAGGIADGRGIAAALMLGAQGIQLGTAFLTTHEASIHPLWKKALNKSSENQTRITSAFTGRPARGIVNRLLSDMEGKESNFPDFPTLSSVVKPLASIAATKGSSDYLSLWAGQSASLTRNLSASKLVDALVNETTKIFENIKIY